MENKVEKSENLKIQNSSMNSDQKSLLLHPEQSRGEQLPFK